MIYRPVTGSYPVVSVILITSIWIPMWTLFLFLFIAPAIVSCSTAPIVSPDRSTLVVGDPLFCAAASNKSAYLGKPLILKGTYETDLRHYSLLSATCDGKKVGFSMGYGPSPIKWTDPVVKKRCEIDCQIEVIATVTGTLVERDDGIDLDFSEILVPEDLTQ